MVSGEFGSVVKGQLNLVRTDVMSGSQSVSIKIVTGQSVMCTVHSTYVHVCIILYVYVRMRFGSITTYCQGYNIL